MTKNVKELQQSPLFVAYIQKLHWEVITIDNQHIFFKNFPLAGGFAKLQRAYPLPNVESVKKLINDRHISRMVIEPSEYDTDQNVKAWVDNLRKHTKVIESPYLQSKSIRIDLRPKEETIFASFSEAKRRAVRRAAKNNLVIREEPTLKELIQVKNKSAGFLGFITTSGAKELESAFGPDHVTTVLAYTADAKTCIGGILLLFWNDIAYYWIAGATKTGKKLFAPTLLAWEAMKIAKKHGALWFDFVGVFDERFPNENAAWKGFTKFKEGFGGQTIYYPTHRNAEGKAP